MNSEEGTMIERSASRLTPWTQFAPGSLPPHQDDIYVTNQKLVVGKDYPSIPSKYAQACEEKRALNVFNIPDHWTPAVVVKLFSAWVKCVASPIIISLPTRTIFRWVVMIDNGAACSVKERLHGMRAGTDQLLLSWPYPPGPTHSVVSREIAEFYIKIKQEKEAATAKTQRHPTPKPETSASNSLAVQSPVQAAKRKSPPNPIMADSDRKSTTDSNVESVAHDIATINIIPPTPAVEEYPTDESPGSGDADMLAVGKRSVKASQQPEAAAASSSFIPAVDTWARIATAAVPKNSVIDIKPSLRSISGPRLNPVGRIPSLSGMKVGNEPMVEQMRLVFLLNLPTSVTLQDISDAIIEGPLMKIQFGHNEEDGSRYAGIIFQYARDAEKFCQVMSKERVDQQPSRFNFIVDCARGEDAFPADDVIRAMGAPIYASRRLTIVKGGFFDMFGERQIQKFCTQVAGGAEHIQKIHLYNIGNATVVFASVHAAIKVKMELDHRAAVAGKNGSGVTAMWKGLLTSFSKDPCVVPLELKSAMPGQQGFE